MASIPVQAVTLGGWETVNAGVEQGDSRGGFGVAAGHFLVGLFVGDQGKRLALAAGAAGGGDGDERQHRPGRLADAPIILHAAAVGEQEIAAFGGVHAAAPAQADDGVDVRPAGDLEAPLDALGAGVFLDAVKGATESPAASSKALTRPAWPAETMPRSVTNSTLRAPSSAARRRFVRPR